MRATATTFKDAGKDFPRGTVLFKEGDTGAEMYLINSGEVRLSRKTKQGVVVLATLGFGEFFGDLLQRRLKRYRQFPLRYNCLYYPEL